MKIRTGDTVKVITGQDKGKSGKVTRVLPKRNAVVVEGINMKKRHRKSRQKNQKGQVVEFAAPIDVSNVALIDPTDNTPTRIGYKYENGNKIRMTKKSGTTI